jgi:hypothetical protein
MPIRIVLEWGFKVYKGGGLPLAAARLNTLRPLSEVETPLPPRCCREYSGYVQAMAL